MMAVVMAAPVFTVVIASQRRHRHRQHYQADHHRQDSSILLHGGTSFPQADNASSVPFEKSRRLGGSEPRLRYTVQNRQTESAILQTKWGDVQGNARDQTKPARLSENVASRGAGRALAAPCPRKSFG
jgi:hypothetical protein